MYTIEIHGHGAHGLGPVSDRPKLVIFEDHSGEFVEGPPTEKPRTSDGTVPHITTRYLPNPHFLRIHSAMCGVLNMSGAGECIDEILGQAGGAGALGAVVSGNDFDHLLLREGLAGAFRAQVSVSG